MQIFQGRIDVTTLQIVGRSVVGLASAEEMAVDGSTNLAIDALSDLEVQVGVVWSGLAANTRIATTGPVFDQAGTPS